MASIRVFLLKEGIQDPSSAIDTELNLQPTPVENDRISQGILYFAQKPTAPKEWKRLVMEVTGIELPDRPGQSDYAAIAVRVRDRWFMIVFGYGANLLDKGMIEPGFGTRVALNLLDKEHVKGLSTRGIGGNPLLTDRQLPAAGPLEAFRISYFDDWVRRIEASPRDGALGDMLIGDDWLTIRRRTLPENVTAFLEEVLDAFHDDAYKDVMPFFDRISTVRDQGLIDVLDHQLAEAIVESPDDVLVGPPTVVDFEEVDGFRFRSGDEQTGVLEVEPSLGAYRSLWRDPGRIYTVSRLRNDHLDAYTEAGQGIGSWSVYSCLYFEVELEGHAYFLTDGHWYEVQKEYKDSLDQDLSELSCDGLRLPASFDGQKEPDYNVAAAQALGWACMDTKYIYPDGETIEVCDLYAPSGDFVHVKVYSGSQTLSHLFNQGFVSASVMMRPPAAREFAELLDQEGHAGEAATIKPPIDPTNHRVVYAILIKPGRQVPEDLPLFAKISLQGALRNLKRLEYPVCVVGVPRP